jgi:hypothetical protein
VLRHTGLCYRHSRGVFKKSQSVIARINACHARRAIEGVYLVGQTLNGQNKVDQVASELEHHAAREGIKPLT